MADTALLVGTSQKHSYRPLLCTHHVTFRLHLHSILFTHHFTLCTVIPSCSPTTSHSAQSSQSALFTYHFTLCTAIPSCSPIISHSAQSFQSALFTYHFTLCTFYSALFTHHFTLCTVIPVCIVHPSLHTLHTCGPQPEAFCFSMPSQFYIHSENNFNSVDYIQVKHR